MVVFTKCISIACGGSMPLAFSDYARIAAENRPENIMAICRVQRGSGHIVLGSVSTEVNSGSLLLLGSGESYTFTAAENILANLIVFDRRLFSSSYAYTLGREALAPMQALARGCELITEKDACYDEVMATVDTIWRAAEAGESCSPLMAVAMFNNKIKSNGVCRVGLREAMMELAGSFMDNAGTPQSILSEAKNRYQAVIDDSSYTAVLNEQK